MDYSIDDWEWLTSQAGIPFLQSLPASADDDRLVAQAWRKHVSPTRVAMLLDQARLRRRADRKVDQPQQWLWTEKLWEQASDSTSARYVASLYPKDRPILDLCSGAGTDAVALAAHTPHPLTAVDLNPIACLLTKYHIKRNAPTAPPPQVLTQPAETLAIDPGCWLHIDPDRRASGTRTTHLDYVRPASTFLQRCGVHSAGGSIKVAPATEVPKDWENLFARHWIGAGSSVRQQRLWWGQQAFVPGQRVATLLKKDSQPTTLTADPVAVDASLERVQPLDPLCPVLGDCHPTLRAAGLTTWLAAKIGATVIGDSHGYLAGATPSPSPWIDWFQILEPLPLDPKRLKQALKQRRIGTLEIKKRGVDVDPDSLRRSLKLSGDASATLLLLRDGKKRLAFLANRLPLNDKLAAD